MIEYKVKNKCDPPELGSVHLKGYVGELLDTFLEGRIFSEHAQRVVYREAEDAFKNCLDDESISGIWQGEYWGKWIISAARVARYTHSNTLREFIREGARTLIGYQRADGYLGTYRDSANVFPPTIEAVKRTFGAEKPLWNWNIWCRKYTLWGMLEAYLLLEDDALLISAVRMADQLIREIETLGCELGETGTFAGVASCSILKPLLLLYRITEDVRYLRFACRVADRWENAAIKPGLIANALSGKRIRDWYPDSNRWAKAYETMSCFDGILELYRITGEEKYLEATRAYYEILIAHEYNALYSVGFNDVFGDAGYDINSATEPCDVVHFMRLSYELYCITAEPSYMDRFELAANTPLLASAFKDGRWGARALRGASRHLVARRQAGFLYNHCCVNNLPRGFMNLAQSAVMSDGEALCVNLYTELSATVTVNGQPVTLEISGDYLANSKAKIELTFPEGPVPVRLRIPAWSKSATVQMAKETYEAAPGVLTLMPRERNTVIELAFDDRVRIVRRSSDRERGDLAWKRARWVSATSSASEDERYVAADPDLFLEDDACLLVKGSVLLCRTKLIGSREDEMFAERRLTPKHTCIECRRVHTTDQVNLEFELTFVLGDEVLHYHVADYASGTNLMTDDKRFFSIYF